MSVEERLDRLGGVALRAARRPAEGDNVVGHVLRMRATRASSHTTYLTLSPRIGSGPAAGRLPDPRRSVSPGMPQCAQASYARWGCPGR